MTSQNCLVVFHYVYFLLLGSFSPYENGIVVNWLLQKIIFMVGIMKEVFLRSVFLAEREESNIQIMNAFKLYQMFSLSKVICMFLFINMHSLVNQWTSDRIWIFNIAVSLAVYPELQRPVMSVCLSAGLPIAITGQGVCIFVFLPLKNKHSQHKRPQWVQCSEIQVCLREEHMGCLTLFSPFLDDKQHKIQRWEKFGQIGRLTQIFDNFKNYSKTVFKSVTAFQCCSYSKQRDPEPTPCLLVVIDSNLGSGDHRARSEGRDVSLFCVCHPLVTEGSRR